jgi:hypothetical protein
MDGSMYPFKGGLDGKLPRLAGGPVAVTMLGLKIFRQGFDTRYI